MIEIDPNADTTDPASFTGPHEVRVFEPDPVPIQLGIEQTGSIHPACDFDRYAFTGTAGQVIQVTTTKIGIGSDLYTEVYAPGGTRLTSVRSRWSSVTSTTPEIRLPADGTYYVELVATGLNTGDYCFTVQEVSP